YRGGAFSVSAHSLTDFAGLNQRLELAGVDEERDFRVGTGDLTLGAGTTLTARHVELSADAGSITLAGTIDASSAGQRGSISVAAHGDLEVTSTGRLLASATDASTPGGKILLATAAGRLDIDTAARIEATGNAGTGALTLRAPTNADATDAAF